MFNLSISLMYYLCTPMIPQIKIYVIYSQVLLPPSNGYVLYNATYSEPLPGFEYYWMPFPIIYAIYFGNAITIRLAVCS